MGIYAPPPQDWQTWSPTLTNLSGGTQTYAKYVQIGKVVHFKFQYTLAGAGVSGAVSFTLPVTAATGYAALDPIGTAVLTDTGVSAYVGNTLILTTTTVQLRSVNAAATSSANLLALSSTVPFTWGNTDVVNCEGTYEAA